MKYAYKVILSIPNGIAYVEILRNTKVETRTEFYELQDFILKNNPELPPNAFITNLICLKNK